jgi:hypothetical protein
LRVHVTWLWLLHEIGECGGQIISETPINLEYDVLH